MITKPTAERILDAAEQMFASNGYDATSLGDVADEVGIRGPGIYKHFKNKQALFEAVVARLLDPIRDMLAQTAEEVTESEVFSKTLIRSILTYHFGNPNFAKLIMHAALAGGEQLDLMSDRWCKPMMESGVKLLSSYRFKEPLDEKDMPTLLIAFTNMVLAYVSLGPLYDRIFDIDTLSNEQIEQQVEIVARLVRGLFGGAGETLATIN